MIARDGALTSLWQQTVPEYQPENTIQPGKLYDVIIVGGGIAGISTALELQKAGKDCLVLEAKTLCFGTTSGTTAHLNTLLDTPYTTIINNFNKEDAKLVAQATREAIQLVKNNIQQYNIDCGFKEVTAYLYAQTNEQTDDLNDIHEALNEVQLDVASSLNLPLNIPFKQALEIRGQAKFHPVQYVHALAKAFEQAGGVILQNTTVKGIEDLGDVEHILVETDTTTFRGVHLIYATHIPPGVNLLHLRCAPWRSYAMAFTLKQKGKQKPYPDELLYDMEDPFHYCRSQQIGDKQYMVVGGEDHKTGHAENANTCFTRLEAFARKYFDIEEIAFKWSSQYFESADGLPYIGHLPGHPGRIFVATGFGGNGITYSGVTATLLKKMIMEEESPYIDLFDPNRVKPVAGFSSFLKHNANVVKNFVEKWFDKEKLESLVELAPGEGKVVQCEGEAMAVYKDDQGILHAVSPICPHLKCEVAWNNAELSWDCPCHGSRFDYNGDMLTGPASYDLEKVPMGSGAVAGKLK